MMRAGRGLGRALALVCSAWPTTITAQTPLTVSPTSHDFGRVAVGATAIHDFAFGGVSLGDSLVMAALSGPDADDWALSGVHGDPGAIMYQPCLEGRTGFLGAFPLVYSGSGCGQRVTFRPRSTGRKRATLGVRARDGSTVRVVLTGEAVEPLCTNEVVWCNFAHLYYGSFYWKIDLRGPAGSNVIDVAVTVDAGKAWCTGSELETGPGGPWRGSITGPGLIGVEFLDDKGTYRITVACPSPEFPDHPDGSAGRASEEAALGTSYSIETYKQTAKAVRADLIGGSNYPAPETDPVNGVTGSVSLTWELTRVKKPPKDRPKEEEPPPPPPPSGRPQRT